MIGRRDLVFCGPAAAALTPYGSAAAPDRLVRIIVPLPAGSVPDVVARLLAERLASQWGVPVVVDNRPGASGAIGVEAAIRAPADGYTLLLGSSGPMAILPAVSRRLSYDPRRNLEPLARVADFPLVVLASTNSGLRSFADLLARTRGPGEPMDYAAGDLGSTQHLAGALLTMMGGLRMNHIPYRAALAHADLIAGRIPVMIDSLTAVLRIIRDGLAVPLAVCGSNRSAQLPQVPTVAEAGVAGYEAVGWMGVFAPAATPGAVAADLSAALLEAARDPVTARRITAAGSDVSVQDGPAFGRFVADELVKWRRLGELAGISID